jgi:hypothetical protein
MEANVAASLIVDLEQKKNVEVGTLIMDDDSATIARVRAMVDHPITKWSDIMHVKKHMIGKLYSLQIDGEEFAKKQPHRANLGRAQIMCQGD